MSREAFEAKMAKIGSPLTRELCLFFEESGEWEIEVDGDGVKAVAPSGYGSGPAVIDLVKLTEAMLKHVRTVVL